MSVDEVFVARLWRDLWRVLCAPFVFGIEPDNQLQRVTANNARTAKSDVMLASRYFCRVTIHGGRRLKVPLLLSLFSASSLTTEFMTTDSISVMDFVGASGRGLLQALAMQQHQNQESFGLRTFPP